MNLAVQLQESKSAHASASKITDAQATQLLTLLVEDDAFRENFEKDPIAALSLIGIYPEDVKSGACMTTEKLASKEELNASRMHLYNYLTSRAVFQNPHYFESGKVSQKFFNKKIRSDPEEKPGEQRLVGNFAYQIVRNLPSACHFFRA